MASKTRRIFFKLVFPFSLIILEILVENVTAKLEDRNPYLNKVTLDKKGKYLLEWMVDWDQNRTIFSATVKTRGYVGLGLSRKGKMSGADIVIGGVFPNGKPYFSDRHAIGHQLPVEDLSQDWTLHSAWENASHTFLSFSRPFETCDEDHDLPINDDTAALIWAYGEKDDDLEYHHENRGSHLTYLLDPDLAPRGVTIDKPSNDILSKGSDVQLWTVNETQILPPKETTYMCSVHRAHTQTKTHIIGFNVVLPTEVDRRHVHHYILYHCNVPQNFNPEEIFEPVLGLKEECYMLAEPIGKIATNFCQEIFFVRGLGQQPFFLPEHVGLPVAENGADYFMLQMHFDNANEVPGIEVNYALELFVTQKLRENDAGVITFGKVFPASPGIMIPPNSLRHSIFGHCGSGCTRKMFPEEGIKAVAATLHTHYAGRSSRLSLIRNNVKLPYIMNDDNYDPIFQKTRVLREERLILPGDQIIQRCVYENTDRNGTVTIGGFSTREEMCAGIMYYYNRVPNHGLCASELRSDVYRKFLRIYNTTWSNEEIEMIVTSPEENAGLAVSEVGNRFNWTIKSRRNIQLLHRYLPQITTCPPNVATSIATVAPEGVTSSDYSDLRAIQRQFILSKRRKYSEPSSSSSSSSSEEVSVNKSQSTAKNSILIEYQKEILNPKYEFVSVYSRNVIPYKKPSSICNKKTQKDL